MGRVHGHGRAPRAPRAPGPSGPSEVPLSPSIHRSFGRVPEPARTRLAAVTRLSSYFLPTEKEAPADAEAVSHRLLVRAGLARQVGAGLWTWLPAGWRSHRRVEQIIREELEAIGCWEMLMPVLQPAEIWKRSGRYDIDEVFKLQDRRGAELVLALSHEENLTFHMAREVRSYRDLPKLLYHFQTKERDEARPRAGVLRTREFIMKDAYSFDRDREGLDRSYELLRGRLRPHLRPRRARVVPGGVRRRGDGRLRRPRVHGALPGRRERRGPVVGRLRRQRGGGQRHPAARGRPARAPWTPPSASRRPRPPPSTRWPASWACPPGRSSRPSRCSWRSAARCWW